MLAFFFPIAQKQALADGPSFQEPKRCPSASVGPSASFVGILFPNDGILFPSRPTTMKLSLVVLPFKSPSAVECFHWPSCVICQNYVSKHVCANCCCTAQAFSTVACSHFLSSFCQLPCHDPFAAQCGAVGSPESFIGCVVHLLTFGSLPLQSLNWWQR